MTLASTRDMERIAPNFEDGRMDTMKKDRVQFFARGFVFLALILLLSGCEALFGPEEEEESSRQDGLTAEIQDIVTEEQLGVLEEDMSLTIYRGSDPPTFNSEYKAEPNTMRATTVPNDSNPPGTVFADYWVRFYDQDNENQTISVDTAQTNSAGALLTSGTGTGGFIVGEGDRFSVFAEVDVFDDSTGITSVQLLVWSGILTSTGITDFEYALLMSNNNGDSTKIPNNTGRSFYDGDGNSPLTSNFPIPNIVGQSVAHPETAPSNAELVK